MTRWWLVLLFAMLPLQSNWTVAAAPCDLLPAFVQADRAAAATTALADRCGSAAHHHNCSACHLAGALPATGDDVLPTQVGALRSGREAETFVPADIPQDIERPKW